MKLANLIAGSAAVALAFTPIAAQAGTRAGDADLPQVFASREASPIADFLSLANDPELDCDNDGILNGLDASSSCGLGGIRWLFVGGLIIGIIALAQGAENDASPGTGG